jgi:hypothetical protein
MLGSTVLSCYGEGMRGDATLPVAAWYGDLLRVAGIFVSKYTLSRKSQ